MSKGPLNYTTTIPVHQTVAQCQSILAAAGASSVAVHFEDGIAAGLSFTLKTAHGIRTFTLPVNIDGVQRMLVQASGDGKLDGRGYRSTRFEGREHAARVAWRVVKDWLEAQLAIIAAQMVSIDEVMLPYLHVAPGVTLYRAYLENEQLAITAGAS